MNLESSEKSSVITFLILGLIIGGSLGFFSGQGKGFKAGFKMGNVQGRNSLQSEITALKEVELQKSIQSANPFLDTEVNPFE